MSRRAGDRGPRLPRCPAHLTPAAAEEWRRVVRLLTDMGVLTAIDRAALAAYCQSWARWIEAEERLQESSLLIRTPSGYVQQSPLLGIVNKQLELMGRYIAELGMTPAARSRVAITQPLASEPLVITRVIVDPAGDAREILREKLEAMSKRMESHDNADTWQPSGLTAQRWCLVCGGNSGSAVSG